MKADEAKRISEENSISLDEAIKIIENCANTGYHQTSFHNMSLDIINDLMGLGYKSTRHKDVINGNEFIIISW